MEKVSFGHYARADTLTAIVNAITVAQVVRTTITTTTRTASQRRLERRRRCFASLSMLVFAIVAETSGCVSKTLQAEESLFGE
jgi:hypothetical protein